MYKKSEKFSENLYKIIWKNFRKNFTHTHTHTYTRARTHTHTHTRINCS